MISAVFAAVAGGFLGHYIGLLSPTPMKFNEMAIIIIMVIAGGFRTFAGPVLGAVFDRAARRKRFGRGARSAWSSSRSSSS